jgi:hypothetical protein
VWATDLTRLFNNAISRGAPSALEKLKATPNFLAFYLECAKNAESVVAASAPSMASKLQNAATLPKKEEPVEKKEVKPQKCEYQTPYHWRLYWRFYRNSIAADHRLL